MTCPMCGSILHITSTGKVCQNCGWRSIGPTGWVSTNSTALLLTISKEESLETRPLETDIKDLTTRVSALEADLKRLKSSTRAKFENVVEQISEIREKCDGPMVTILSAEGHEKAKEDLLRALEESDSVPPIIDLPKPIHYVYIIRERTDEGWNIVGNICYLTFKDANEKMKRLIRDFRQLDPDYDANNLNILQVKVTE